MARAPRHAEVRPLVFRPARAMAGAWARGVHGFGVAGSRNIPADRGCLVVCNHLADSDGMFVGAALPPPPPPVIHLVTARHHRAPAPVRELLLALGLQPVRTDGTEMAALRRARRMLQEGAIVVVYPEGVPGYSARVGRFADGAGWLALTPGIDVVPAAVWGTQRVMRRGLPLGRGPVRVAFGAPMTFGPLTGSRAERVVAATGRLRAGVQRLVTALAGADPGAARG